MPVPFMKGMLPPPGMAYAALCMEGGGFGTIFFQRDPKGCFSHTWFEIYKSDGTCESISHAPGGASKTEMVYKYDDVHRMSRFSSPEEFMVFEGVYDDYNRIKIEKWGPLLIVNDYSRKDKKIQRIAKIDLKIMSSIINYRNCHGF